MPISVGKVISSCASSEVYSRLLYAVHRGYLVFVEVLAAATWLGGAIMIASTIYIAIPDTRLSRAGLF